MSFILRQYSWDYRREHEHRKNNVLYYLRNFNMFVSMLIEIVKPFIHSFILFS